MTISISPGSKVGNFGKVARDLNFLGTPFTPFNQLFDLGHGYLIFKCQIVTIVLGTSIHNNFIELVMVVNYSLTFF